MKAWRYHRYGPPEEVLEFGDVDTPEAREDDQLLVRVRAASVNPADWHPVVGTPYLLRPSSGWRRPKRGLVGTDVAGVVEAVGSGVTRLQPGDEVFGAVGGSFAEYATGREKNLVHKPGRVSFEEAASVPIAAVTALQGLRDKGGLQAGHHVLVNGASGGVGTFAVQIAKALGAEVTAVCSTRNVETVTAIGADRVVDYTKDDFTKTADRYDVILDNVGNRSVLACRRLLKPEGRYVMVSGPRRAVLGPMVRIARAKLLFLFGGRDASFFVAQFNEADLTFLAGLLESGEVEPVIERTFELSGAAEALAYMGEGHARGKLVVTV